MASDMIAESEFICFFNDTAPTEIYTLSLHDALPILGRDDAQLALRLIARGSHAEYEQMEERLREEGIDALLDDPRRSEEHTSELQSRQYLVCRLLLEKKQGY